MKRIAVIGAGSNGLGAIKSLLEEGLEPVCFEQTNNVGGLWNYTDEDCPDRGTVFKGVVSNSSKGFLAYSDFPQPEDCPLFLPHYLVARYFNSYAEHFGLKKYIRFEHKILQVRPVSNYESSGKWEIQVLDLKEKIEFKEIFDGVMVCSGHHSVPKFPNFPGCEDFKGKQIHSRDYRTPDRFENQNVVVVGFGNSACDIATECSFWAKQVTLSTRRRGWILPRAVSGIEAVDSLLHRYHFILQSFLPRSYFQTQSENVANQHFNHEHLGVKPGHRIDNQYPLINDIIQVQIINGKIKIEKGITRLTENSVVLNDGRELLNIDTIIYSTGFRRKFHFLEGVVDAENDLNSFYKFVFPARLSKNTLAFIGLSDPDIATINSGEMQSRWVSRVFSGKVGLPTPEEMIKDATKAIQNNIELFTEKFCIDNYITSVPYTDQLASFIGVKPSLWSMFFTDPKLFWACFTGPILPHQYRLRGPHAWPNARQKILSYYPEKKKSTSKLFKFIVICLPFATAISIYFSRGEIALFAAERFNITLSVPYFKA